MKQSKQKLLGSVMVRTDRETGLTIAIKLCGNHIKVATALAGKGEKFKHKHGINLALLNLQDDNKFNVLPINHKGSGLSKEQRLIGLMNNLEDLYTDISWGT